VSAVFGGGLRLGLYPPLREERRWWGEVWGPGAGDTALSLWP
jgi:hypothetical protein